MDVTSPKPSADPSKRPRTLSRHAYNIFLWLVIIGAIIAAGIWFKNKSDKARNLRDTALQELKQPQRIALEAVAADSGAKELLGDDIQDAGGLKRDGGGGELDRSGTVIHFEVKGSKQTGSVTASAALEKGAWQVTSEIEVKAADGKTMSIPKPAEKPPDIEL